jgi:hypothetical protein
MIDIFTVVPHVLMAIAVWLLPDTRRITARRKRRPAPEESRPGA